MTIVAASVALSTSWAEWSVISVSASQIGSLSNLIDEVGLKINRGAITSSSIPSDSQIAQWLVRGKQEFAKTKMYTWRRRYMTLTTVSGQWRYALPEDFDGGPCTLRDLTNDKILSLISNSRFDSIVPNPSEETSDSPIYVTIKNLELWIAPCGGSVQLEIEYLRSGDDSNTPTDFSWIPEQERWNLIDYAASEAFEYLHDFDKSGWYKQKYSGGVAMARKADSKRKWSTSEKRGRNIFQAR